MESLGINKGFDFLLKYLDKKLNITVIINDIARLARDEAYSITFILRLNLQKHDQKDRM
ncbi:DUF1788 domain-containing protein [Rickettsiales endosymbiont of Stachyamoeba lipophora]|uniref:DUF1788 domain-containing protein n=1 Tax=Rickettsiales endosymbiont of Stachyamoeba lipophora TaxID=2486578 RepID=UPI0013DDEA6D|nr:DUF1788 domain-containing protein [Rickettsiales endosymbiont of Stachyamoeba lipophora]